MQKYPEKRSIVVRNGRIFELLNRYYRVSLINERSVDAVFKTGPYRHRQKHIQLIFNRIKKSIQQYIDHTYDENYRWRVQRTGSIYSRDILAGTRQEYEIILEKNDTK